MYVFRLLLCAGGGWEVISLLSVISLASVLYTCFPCM